MHTLECDRELRKWCFGSKHLSRDSRVRAEDEDLRGQLVVSFCPSVTGFMHSFQSFRMFALSYLQSLSSSRINFSHIVSFAILFSFGILCANKEFKGISGKIIAIM